MRLVVLGNPDRYLASLSGGSGYLVEADGAALLLDCGPGVHAAPPLGAAAGRVRAVLLSHMHFDHCADLPTVLAALPSARLVLPPGGRASLQRLGEAYLFDGPFDHAGGLDEAGDGWEATLGPFRVRAAATRHSAPSLAWRVEAEGASLVYASDTAPCPELLRLAEDADALLAHALLPTVEEGSAHAAVHSTAAAACELAAEANVSSLFLSHRFHGEPAERFLATAKEAFFGRIVLLEPGQAVEV